jgi:hypothetical protein
VYYFVITSFGDSSNTKKDDITFFNLKEKLLSYDFSENITIKCIEDDLSCLIFVDDNRSDQTITSLLSSKPEVYEYSKELNRIEFPYLELEQLQRYEVVFQYSCNKNKKCSEYIVQTDEMVYILNDIQKKPSTLKYINDLDEYFDKSIQKVRNAF